MHTLQKQTAAALHPFDPDTHLRCQVRMRDGRGSGQSGLGLPTQLMFSKQVFTVGSPEARDLYALFSRNAVANQLDIRDVTAGIYRLPPLPELRHLNIFRSSPNVTLVCEYLPAGCRIRNYGSNQVTVKIRTDNPAWTLANSFGLNKKMAHIVDATQHATDPEFGPPLPVGNEYIYSDS